MNRILVVGGGGHAKVVIGILRKLKEFEVIGYTDPNDHGPVAGAPYLGTDSDLMAYSDESAAVNVALGVGQIGLGVDRYTLWSRLQARRFRFPFIVSPHAVLNDGVTGGEASIVMDGAVLNWGAVLGDGVIVNTNCTIEHDVVLADWVHVAPGAVVSGGATVGRFTMIGAGATVIQNVAIAESCIVGAGATVVADLKDPGTYVGCPARRIR
jgi:sugar O-acyltransferase (sialic acid O-acetyltransferase NeuD family)